MVKITSENLVSGEELSNSPTLPLVNAEEVSVVAAVRLPSTKTC